MKSQTLTRQATIQAKAVDEEKRTVEVAFSSELPVARFFGNEILLHGRDNVDLSRFQYGGAVLVDHDPKDHVGVIEKASIDPDRKGRALLRFGKSKRASEVFQDVIDGIRVNVSVGYEIRSAIEDESANTPTYLIDDWCPHEISFTSLPADKDVGVGRNLETVKVEEVISMKTNQAGTGEVQKKASTPEQTEAQKQAIEDARASAGKAEQERVRSIYNVGNKHELPELAEKAVNENWAMEKFQGEVLKNLESRGTIVRAQDQNIGMTKTETQKFSFQRLINAMANPNDQRAARNAAFELDCSSAYAERIGKDPKGAWVPPDVIGTQQRDVTVAGTGSNLVATDLLASQFIDLLVDKTPLIRGGHVRMLTGLVGDLAIPKLTGGSAHYWLAENEDVTLSDVTFGQVGLSPKTIAVMGQLSRKLMLQSTPDAERIIRMDLAREMGLGIHNALINGTGLNNQPTGLLNTNGLGVVPIGTDGGTITHELIESLLTGLEVDNAEDGSLIYLTNPKVKAQLRTLKLDAGSGRFLDERMEYPLFITNQVPSDLSKGSATGTLSALVLGSFRENLMLGMWSGLDITVDPYTGASSGKTRIVMFQDVDVAVRRIESFRAILDIVTG